jgi:hypothetical protein
MNKIIALTLAEYAKLVGYNGVPTTLEQIQDYLEEIECDLWDYPLAELEYCIREDRSVVLVNTEFGLRLCEIE